MLLEVRPKAIANNDQCEPAPQVPYLVASDGVQWWVGESLEAVAIAPLPGVRHFHTGVRGEPA